MDTKQLETKLEDVFVKGAPALPSGAKKFIADVAPWVTLLLGVFSLWSAYNLWQWAHAVDRLADYVNTWSAALGVQNQQVSRMSFAVWLSLAALAVQGVIYLMAFSPLKERKKRGWDLMFYVTLFAAVVGLVGVFVDGPYGGVGRLFGTLIGAAIGLYILFQVKSEYEGKKAAPAKPAAPDAPKQ